jgi:HlyD family secretion protein
MPAEAFLRTADRTVLSYLLGPLAAQLSHAFRED